MQPIVSPAAPRALIAVAPAGASLRFFLPLLLLCLVLPRAADAQTERGDVRIMTIQSAALAGNLAGDPAEQTYAVYLPPGYTGSSERYPVIFLLHGIGDSHDVWIKWKVPELLDRLISSKRIAPVIVVMPNGRNRFLGSYYLNSTVTGRWADLIADEIVTAVDREFRTIPGRDSRAVAGHSMGGFGAIRFGMDRPDVFSVVYAISPCCLDSADDVGFGNFDAWKKALAFKSYGEVDEALQRNDFYPVAAIGLLSAMVPDRTQPMNVRFPVKASRWQLVPAHPAYDQLLAQFPVRAVAAHRDNLLKLRALAIDVGFDDQWAHIPRTTAAFTRELFEQRIPFTLDAYDGDHRGRVLERMERIVFPFIAETLKR
jgi:S-formylglutathione hydrolase